MVNREHMENTTRELEYFARDMCEEICDGDPECIRSCHSGTDKAIREFIESIDRDVTTPSDLKHRVDSFKLKLKNRFRATGYAGGISR